MNESRMLHQEAMAIAQNAYLLREAGNIKESSEAFNTAFLKERQAALLARDNPEPSRSVLFRSAATLAYNISLFREAEEMVAYGLIGSPPDEIAEELIDLLEQINFGRHLQVRGRTLPARSRRHGSGWDGGLNELSGNSG